MAGIVWHQPCAGTIELHWESLGAAAAAQHRGSTWCSIYVNTDEPMGWAEFCTLMIHEYGHVAGKNHREDVRSVMNAAPADDPRCAKRGVYLERRCGRLRRELS